MIASAAAQCGIVADLTPGTANNGNIAGLVAAYGNELYFQGVYTPTGSELWKWTEANGASLVVDLAPGGANTSPQHITPCCTALGPRVFFSGFEIGHGHELYASDGTAAGTGRVKEIQTGSGSSLPGYFAASGGRVFFNARETQNGEELWVSDGTAAGTVRLSDFAPGTGNGRPNDMIDLNGLVLFSAFDPTTGRELFISDGTPAGTHILLDIEPGPVASSPGEFTRVGDQVYFTATTSVDGMEVWKTDGTTAGTVTIGNVFTGNSVGPAGLCACGDRLFFHEWTGSSMGEVYVTDGTLAGTVNLLAGTFAVGTRIVCSGNRVFFAASHFASGVELWTSDGTIAGTGLVADLNPGALGSNPYHVTDCGTGVCFTAQTVTWDELWFSDGTAAGTTMLCTLDPGGNAGPDQLTMCRGRLFFEAYDPAYGRELFGVATPGASTAQLGSGGRPDYPQLRTSNGGVPVLGTTVGIEGDGPVGYAAVLLAGGPALPVPLPNLPGFLEGGCDWVGLQAGTAITVGTLFSPSSTVWLAIPNNAAFEGIILNFEAVWFHPSASPTLQVSSGLQLVLGTAAPH